MIKEERQKLIIEKLNRDQKINLVDLSQLLNVSYDSIRRDVIELEDKGLLKKVHGGIVSNSYLSFRTTQGFGADNRELSQLTKKAIKLFDNQRIVLLDGGTTNFHIAEQLPKNAELTIITNSPSICEVLSEHTKVETLLLGGNYHKRYQITTGTEVMRQLDYLRPDLYIMGFNGIHPEQGITLRTYEEAKLKQKMMQVSKKVALCPINEKFGHVENFKICDICEAHTLVSNYKPTDTFLNPYRKEHLEII
ncbi:MAG: DeoR/GlpR family DNA-binding transcription regulator [Spirosomaceae bacterium]|jgi:DeoR/GlpR family transcriptional regulator of sugar metabolism|nr:DeoR/GlpR family DNA-binding transcription regulator [Spirosomataceae bacterium]